MTTGRHLRLSGSVTTGPVLPSPEEPAWVPMATVLKELREAGYIARYFKRPRGRAARHVLRVGAAETMRRGMQINVTELMNGVSQRRFPNTDDDESALRASGGARAENGVTVSDLARVSLIAHQYLVDEILTLSAERGIPDEIVVESLQYADGWMAWQMRAILAGHRDASLVVRARKIDMRERGIRQLLSGGLTPVETAAAAEECGIDVRGAYHVVCIPLPESLDASAVRRMLAGCRSRCALAVAHQLRLRRPVHHRAGVPLRGHPAPRRCLRPREGRGSRGGLSLGVPLRRDSPGSAPRRLHDDARAVDLGRDHERP